MDRNSIAAKVKEILVSVLELDLRPTDISDDDAIFDRDINADSIGALEIITGIEDEFGFMFDDEEVGIAMFESVSSLTNAVERKIKAQAGAGS